VNIAKLHVHKKAAIESCLIVPVENCFEEAGDTDKRILPFLIVSYKTITKHLFTAARYAVKYVRFNCAK